MLKLLNLSIEPNLKVYILSRPQFIINQQLSGAAEARRAHNPEGNGSKPFSAITFVFFASVKHYLSSLWTHTRLIPRRTEVKMLEPEFDYYCKLTAEQPQHRICDLLKFSIQSSTIDIVCTIVETLICSAELNTFM